MIHRCWSCGASAKAQLCAPCRDGRATLAREEGAKSKQAIKRTAYLADFADWFARDGELSYIGGATGIATDYAEAVRAAEYHARRAASYALLPMPTKSTIGDDATEGSWRDPEVFRLARMVSKKAKGR